MSRLARRNRTDEDLGMKVSGGMLDLIDNSMKAAFRITDKEYDYLCEKMSDAEMDLLFKEDNSFAHRRECYVMVENHLKNFKL